MTIFCFLPSTFIQAYDQYENLRVKDIRNFKEDFSRRRLTTVCRVLGCRRVFGRKGFCFCTEDIDKCCAHKVGNPAPPFLHEDIDDENDAARILQTVLGDPPKNVAYVRSSEEKSPLPQPPGAQTLVR